MKKLAVIVLLVAAFLWLRLRYLRFIAPVREERKARESRMRQALSDPSRFVGQPVQLLLDAFGRQQWFDSMDFGLDVYTWKVNDLRVDAFVKNGVCVALEKK